MRPQPIRRGHTPPVARNETGESILGHRRGQVVADLTLVIEKFLRDDRADRVTSDIFHACGAITVPVEASKWVRTAWVQITAKDVLADQLDPRRVTLIRGMRTCPSHPRCRPPMPPPRSRPQDRRGLHRGIQRSPPSPPSIWEDAGKAPPHPCGDWSKPG